MSWISTPQLVAAVSNAGGLGILASGPLSPEATRKSINEIRALTDKPFGIGCTLLMPGARENAEVALEMEVPVINISLGKGEDIIERCHAYGGRVITTVVTEKHARSAEAMGADALMVTGHEAAAHGGDATSFVLVPCMASKFPDLPLICAGGVGDGRGLAAMLALGADGVAMGSRLAVSTDSPLAEEVKQQVVELDEQDTIYGTNFDGLGARVMKTPASVVAMKQKMNPVVAAFKAFGAAKLINLPLWKVIPGLLTQWTKMYQLSLFGAATDKLMKATIDGNLDEGVQFIGQSQGLINDVASAQTIIDRCVTEAIETNASVKERYIVEEPTFVGVGAQQERRSAEASA